MCGRRMQTAEFSQFSNLKYKYVYVYKNSNGILISIRPQNIWIRSLNYPSLVVSFYFSDLFSLNRSHFKGFQGNMRTEKIMLN